MSVDLMAAGRQEERGAGSSAILFVTPQFTSLFQGHLLRVPVLPLHFGLDTKPLKYGPMENIQDPTSTISELTCSMFLETEKYI